jgi:hypothetical protein
MGRHGTDNGASGSMPSSPRAGSPKRPFSLKRLSVSVLGFAAALGFVAVSIVDPYSGTTASPYFQVAPRFEASDVQSLALAAGYDSSFTRDVYESEAAPPPPPPPVPTEDPADDGSAFAPPAVTPDPGSAQDIAQQMVAARGWGDDQFSCLVALWNKESGWRVNAFNASSGAYGIPQSLPGNKMATAGPDWQTNPATQISWGLTYIAARYGSPCGAWAHSEAVGSY